MIRGLVTFYFCCLIRHYFLPYRTSDTFCRFLMTMIVVIFLACLPFCLGNRVRAKCPPTEDICEFHLNISQRMTMARYLNGHKGQMTLVEVAQNGTFINKDKHCRNRTLLEDTASIMIGDGTYKLATVFNDQLPGPPIVVYRGQRVVVTLTNSLDNHATSLHFHGIRQVNTPWMDGAGGISHCPINPTESFQYRFVAEPVGTHWYHSHIGTQRTEGAHGPLIVLDRSKDDENKRRGRHILPDFDDEFYMVVTDWMKNSSFDVLSRIRFEMVSYSYGWDSDVCFNSTKQEDGLDCGVTPFDSATINGKGRHYDRSYEPENRGVPLEEFIIKKGGKYRFRAIVASMTFVFKMSIDNHKLHVISTDGCDIQEKVVDSVVISSGERYDFWVEANDPEELGNYWIKAETLEATQNGKPIFPGYVAAILRYDHAEKGDPKSHSANWTTDDKCFILNNPIQHINETTESFAITDLRQTTDEAVLVPETEDDFVEYFLNFHFSKHPNGEWKPTVNGIQNIKPVTPLQTYNFSKEDVKECDKQICERERCRCTNMLEIPLGKIVQITLLITVQNPPGLMNGNSHPVHVHGHSFQVLKIGWPKYDPHTNFYKGPSDDFKCTMNDNCNVVEWSNQSWYGGNIEGLTPESPVRKDTVNIAPGSYVVVRFKAENPGYWYVHCHTEFHEEEGMALIIKEGNHSQMNDKPKNMRTCGNFEISREDFLENLKQTPSQDPDTRKSSVAVFPCSEAVNTFILLSIVFGALTVFFMCTSVLMYCKNKSHKGYTLLQDE